jgi:hypothetical protein
MSRSDSRPGPTLGLFIPPRRWSPDQIGAPPRRVSQVPQPIFLRAPSPTTPRSPAPACAPYFTASFRFPLHAKIDHFPFALTRPNRVHLCYGSRVRLARLRQTDCSAPRSLGYLLNGQLTGQAPFSLQDQPGLSWRSINRFFMYATSWRSDWDALAPWDRHPGVPWAHTCQTAACMRHTRIILRSVKLHLLSNFSKRPTTYL